MSNPINEKRSMTVLLWNYLENRDIFLTFAGKMKKLVIIFTLLVALCCCTTEGDRNRMRAGLDSINARNRNDLPFTVQDVKPYVQFFDDEGTPNDRLLAHYLLGRAYYEAGEAPMALECYHDAIDCADTTAKDCDFAQLSRVYSQMGWVFHGQLLLSHEITSRTISKHYSIIAQDMPMAAYETELIASAYILQNKDESAYAMARCAMHEFNSLSLIQDSIQASLILMHLLAKQATGLNEMKQLIDVFDTKSNLFDKDHELHSHNRLFYYYKGQYFEGVGHIDSAEYYYRKISYPNMSYTSQNSMYKGLLSIFTKRHVADSISKYSQLYCNANDSSIAKNDRQLTAQMASSYHYGTIQHKMHESEAKAHRASIGFFIVLVLCMAIAIAAFVIWRKVKHQQEIKKQEIEKVKKEYNYLYFQYEDNIQLLQSIQDNYNRTKDAIDVVKEENNSLKSRIAELLKQQAVSDMIDNCQQYVHTSIVQQVLDAANSPKGVLTKKELAQLTNITANYFPNLQKDLNQIPNITNQEAFVAILVILNIRTDDIARMLNVSSQRITNIKASLNESLFGVKSARLLSSNLKKNYGVYLPKG